MAIAFTRISYWFLRGGKSQESPKSSPSTDSINFQLNIPSTIRSSRRIRKKKQQNNNNNNKSKEKRVDREYDLVIVPSDGGECLSGSESDGSDWSIGWLEPHSHDFYSDGESEDNNNNNSFAVLVPCYGRILGKNFESIERNLNFGFGENRIDSEGFSENKDFVEQWLSSLPSELLNS